MNSRIQAKVSHRFKMAAERVYDAWLNSEQVRTWMAAALKSMGLAGDITRVEIHAKVGGKFFFSDMRDGQEAKHWGTYLELDRPRRIIFTWIVNQSEEENPSQVTLTIQSEPNGCTATIVHELDAKWAEYVDRTESGWSCMLSHIELTLI
jgi:uncharacterized protein YndB with AHSA1/START domain